MKTSTPASNDTKHTNVRDDSPGCLPVDPASVAAVIPAAGSGVRMGLPQNKVLLPFGESGSTVLSETIRRVLEADVCSTVVIVARPCDREACEKLVEQLREIRPGCAFIVASGGTTRQESVRNGLLALAEKPPIWALIHDGARPFCSPALIRSVAGRACEKGAAILATPSRQTLKYSKDGSVIEKTVPRTEVWEAQTPQVFRYAEILAAHENAASYGFEATDDSQLLERLGGTVVLVAGDEKNLKITTPFDLAVMRAMVDPDC